MALVDREIGPGIFDRFFGEVVTSQFDSVPGSLCLNAGNAFGEVHAVPGDFNHIIALKMLAGAEVGAAHHPRDALKQQFLIRMAMATKGSLNVDALQPV